VVGTELWDAAKAASADELKVLTSSEYPVPSTQLVAKRMHVMHSLILSIVPRMPRLYLPTNAMALSLRIVPIYFNSFQKAITIAV